MEQFGYGRKTVARVGEIILAHSCEGKLTPKTLEGKILATADAMSHFAGDFYLAIAATGPRDAKSFKKWAMEKYPQFANLIQTAQAWHYGIEMDRRLETAEFIKFALAEAEKRP